LRNGGMSVRRGTCSRARALALHNGSKIPSSPRSDDLVTEPLVDDPGAAPPGSLWARMKADPQYAPEHLALEAVRRLGPEARRSADAARARAARLTRLA